MLYGYDFAPTFTALLALLKKKYPCLKLHQNFFLLKKSSFNASSVLLFKVTFSASDFTH
jgi:hypothetical protein